MLYRYIKRDRLAGGKLYLQLPHHGKYYRYDKGECKRSPIPDRVGIQERPAEADLKQQLGHFEIDTVFGKDQKSFLLTLADKATKQIIIQKLTNKRADTVVDAFRDIVANTFCDFKTLTANNGSEFSMHKQITEITGARCCRHKIKIPRYSIFNIQIMVEMYSPPCLYDDLFNQTYDVNLPFLCCFCLKKQQTILLFNS